MMKALLSFILLLLVITAKAQKAHLTKINCKVVAECKYNFQMTRKHKPAGQVFLMVADSFIIAIDSLTTGFILKCRKGDPLYIPIPYRPGQGFLRKLSFVKCKPGENKYSIQPFFQ
jgi:hypothetical protein